MVGLDGTGDKSGMPITGQAMQNYLQQAGISLPAGATAPQLKNVATVIGTAQLPACAQPGQFIDINVSSIGNAKSLRGGTLIATPLLTTTSVMLVSIGLAGIGYRLQQTPELTPHSSHA